LASVLDEAGLQVGLWAADHSEDSTPFLSRDSNVQRLTGSLSEALSRFGRIDIIHDNGIWLLHNHRLARFAAIQNIPRLVSTRGMLEPWAIEHKWLKKRIAWTLYQRADLVRAQCHHTTAEAEARNLRGLDLKVPIRTISNGVDLPKLRSSHRDLEAHGNKRIALFVGRIYPVKGLPMLIEAWARVRPQNWILQIAGLDEAGHRAELERAIARARLGECISFIGAVADEAKEAAFLGADLFVLPSHSESFGMSIAEALAHALPVLTTTGAPWPSLKQHGCGWWVDPSVDGVTEGLRQATSLDSPALRAMGKKGRVFVASQFGWQRIARDFVGLYENLLACRKAA
jgi:glycosyltransferase involved in cell wall biosynthesis